MINDGSEGGLKNHSSSFSGCRRKEHWPKISGSGIRREEDASTPRATRGPAASSRVMIDRQTLVEAANPPKERENLVRSGGNGGKGCKAGVVMLSCRCRCRRRWEVELVELELQVELPGLAVGNAKTSADGLFWGTKPPHYVGGLAWGIAVAGLSWSWLPSSVSGAPAVPRQLHSCSLRCLALSSPPVPQPKGSAQPGVDLSLITLTTPAAPSS